MITVVIVCSAILGIALLGLIFIGIVKEIETEHYDTMAKLNNMHRDVSHLYDLVMQTRKDIEKSARK